MDDKPHVFVVGFPRCGSASLCQALSILGWRPIHNPRNWDQLQGHNAAGDVFVTAHWRELLAIVPDAKFILNTRPFLDWLESLKRIPGFWRSGLLYDRYYRHVVYGTHNPRERNALAKRFCSHHEAVVKEVPAERLLSVGLPFAWEPLCEFLGAPVPVEPFPHHNNKSCRDAVVRRAF